ncbi:MAG: phosphate acetyltransferase [Gammaproteobacteria bacterium]|jgi:phosphate acetyltransferase|nr:phosphate acetyltransferase [Gammaproteobacteria bacterium]
MAHVILLAPTGVGVGLSTVVLGLERAFEELGVRVKRFKPIEQAKNSPVMPTTLSISHVEKLLGEGSQDIVLQEVLENFQSVAKEADVILVQGLIVLQEQPYTTALNAGLAMSLDAKVIIVTTPGSCTSEELSNQIEITARNFSGLDGSRILGCIANKIGGPELKAGDARLDLGYLYQAAEASMPSISLQEACAVFKKDHMNLLGCIPWNDKIIAPRMKDIAVFLGAEIIHAGEIETRRVSFVTLCARGVNHITDSLQAEALIVTPGDRSDVILATCMAALSGVNIAGLLLTGGYEPDVNIMKLCRQALLTGLPVLSVDENSFRSAVRIHYLNNAVPEDDKKRIDMVKDFVAAHISKDWVQNFIATKEDPHLSPAAFRYQLSELAKRANRKIVLPEGAEPRTVMAAASCAQQGLARCILLGDAEEIHRVAENNGVTLGANIVILDPKILAPRYIERLVELRKDKGMTEVLAEEYLHDPVVVGTMMLEAGEVDGLVSGAIHTTANTIRPALQIIKTAPNATLVSSVFFMCMPSEVLVFADCAVNPDPNVEELAQIAIQSADTAKIFNIMPRVAMISYSTGSSGMGQDVDKVRQATELVKKLRPDLIIDGPLQYDAALIPEVARQKAPGSPVAGKATVFIFPDLNTGNTTYKAVQRSADVLAVGPMLQGLRKPVNDLSRGATVEDIVYTIAMTAVQAVQEKLN